MRRFLVGLLATIGALCLLVVVGAVAATVYVARVAGRPEVPERVVLTLDLREAPEEVGASDPLAWWFRGKRALTQGELLLVLDRAARDPRVAGLVARLDGEGPGLAQIQELRDGVAALRERGKFALAFADSFGELSPGTIGYYLATAFDEIHLQPLGFVGLTGVAIETPLARELFDELGVTFQIETRGEYKSAAEPFTRSELSPASREMLEALADDVIAQIARGIASGRGKDEAEVRRLIDGGPYLPDEAVAGGLVDTLSYHDEVVDRALARAGDGAATLTAAEYAARLEPEEVDGDDGLVVVALVQGTGRIVRGESEAPLVGSVLMGADTVAEALSDAADDPAVAAILFRIDSPGGSPVASEAIAREVRRAVAAGKPVIVSMGNVAASGGYWIAMDASRIVAAPGTLTGSIGVIAGKPVVTGLSEELGVNWGTVRRGANASMFSLLEGYGPAGRARLEAFLDATYGAFIAGVARGRDLPEEEVRAAAQGRVWTGEQAAELGLVDELGGLPRALEVARETLGLGADEPVELRRFPPPRSPLKEVMELLPLNVGALASLDALLGVLRPGALSAPALVLR